MVDYYATEEVRKKEIKLLARNEAKIQEKRAICREYCEKFLEHVTVMRKDLLNLESNEDALELHEELHHITETMRSFGIGLEDSVMKEPTRINLADWKNLCLFRVAIIRRRVTATGIYIEKTGSAEILIKIEAFLYAIWKYLTAGEWDEYEIQSISEEPFFNVSFLLCQSTIQDPVDDLRKSEKIPQHAVKLNPTNSPIKAELFPEPAAEPEKSNQPEPEPTQDPENAPEEAPEEKPTPRTKKHKKRKKDKEKAYSEYTDLKPNNPSENSEPVSYRKPVPDDSTFASEGTLIETDSPNAEDADNTQSALDNPELKDETPSEVSQVSELDTKSEPESSETQPGSPKKKKDALTSPSITRHLKSRRAPSDRPEQSKRSPLLGRFVGKQDIKARSLARFTGKKKLVASLTSPILNGQLERLEHSGRRKWKPFWSVLNSEKLEFYKDERCSALSHTINLDTIKKISFSEPGGETLDIRKSGNDTFSAITNFATLRRSARTVVQNKEFEFILHLDSEAGAIRISNQIELSAGSRTTMLKWCISLHSVVAAKYSGSLLPDAQHESFLKELYGQEQNEATLRRGDEEWVYQNGKLSNAARSQTFLWDGVSLSTQKGSTRAVWDGFTFQWSKELVAYSWFESVNEFRLVSSGSSTEEETKVVWSLFSDCMVQTSPKNSEAASNVWKFASGSVLPPLAICVEILSGLPNEPEQDVGSPGPTKKREKRKKKKTKEKTHS